MLREHWNNLNKTNMEKRCVRISFEDIRTLPYSLDELFNIEDIVIYTKRDGTEISIDNLDELLDVIEEEKIITRN